MHRRFHHNQLTFGQLYAYTENFVLPLSHDEVVHGKGSLLDKMPGDAWQKFANLRLLLTYQMATPGKKLNFMGNELAQGREWRVGGELDWGLLGIDWHQGVQTLVRDLNRLYREPARLARAGFRSRRVSAGSIATTPTSRSSVSSVAHAAAKSWWRFNFTPVPRQGYRVGVPYPAPGTRCSTATRRSTPDRMLGNAGGIHAEAVPWMGHEYSAQLTMPPLGAVFLIPGAG